MALRLIFSLGFSGKVIKKLLLMLFFFLFFSFSVFVSLFSFTGDDGKANEVASDETKEKGVAENRSDLSG